MKKILTFALILTFTFLLVSCDFSLTTNGTTLKSSQTTTFLDSSSSESTLNSTNKTNSKIESTVQTTDSTVQTTETTTETTTQTTTEPVVYDRYQTINLYSINDFHGGTYCDVSYLENIGGFLKDQLNDETKNAVVLSNGDIFQGAALSNYYYGEPIVEAFNEIGFDGFIIGNHEFDWGIDKVLEYRDGSDENGEMDYPIVAANIVYTDTQLPLENTIPYIVKEVSGVKVGVIGLIGEVINSISASRVNNIEFKDPTDTASYYARELRVEQDCDIVVVYIHEGSSRNSDFANLKGDYLIDAVFNGHTHQDEFDNNIDRYHSADLFAAQASARDSSLFAHISITYDTLENEIISGSSETMTYGDVETYSDDDVKKALDDFENDTVYQTFVSELLTNSSNEFSKYVLAEWGGSVIREYLGLDVGAVNSGGFRHSLEAGDLTMGDLIELYPFDNYIKTCEMTGSELEYLYNSLSGDDVVWDNQIYYIGSKLYVNGEALVSSKTYTIGAVDYIFDKEYFGFLDGDNITLTTYLMRDLLVEDLRASVGAFNPNIGSDAIDPDDGNEDANSEVLATSSSDYNKTVLAVWGASVMRDYLGLDVGALNSGGFSQTLDSGDITLGDLNELYPFDNYVKTCEMTGSKLQALYDALSDYDVYWDDQIYYVGVVLYVNNEPVISNDIYTIGAADYIFNKTSYGFLEGDNITATSYLVRKLLEQDLRSTDGIFDPTNGTSYETLSFIYDPNYFEEIRINLI